MAQLEGLIRSAYGDFCSDCTWFLRQVEESTGGFKDLENTYI